MPSKIANKDEGTESSSKENLTKEDHLKNLKGWTEYPFMDNYKFCGLKIPRGFDLHKLFGSKITYAHEFSVLHKFGFAEGISALVRTVKLEGEVDEVVNMEELKTKSEENVGNNDEVGALVDSFLALFQNFGVIGALIISVLFPLLLANSSISTTSQLFFGDKLVHAFYYIFLKSSFLTSAV